MSTHRRPSLHPILLPTRCAAAAAALVASIASPSAWAGGEQALEKVEITGNKTNLTGVADSANVGTVTQKQLEARTVYRPGELLESAPG